MKINRFILRAIATCILIVGLAAEIILQFNSMLSSILSNLFGRKLL